MCNMTTYISSAFQNNSNFDTYYDDYSLLSDLASNCGMDWSKLQHRMTFDERKITRGIELGKSYRGKVFAVGSQFTARNGRDYRRITFYTNKHGGVTETYNEWTEEQANKPFKPYIPFVPFKKKTPLTLLSTAPVADENSPSAKQITDLRWANDQWEAASTALVAEHSYLIKKNLPIAGIEIRRGMGRFGDCLMVQIFNFDRNNNLHVIGYQHLYADIIPGRKDNKDFVGQMRGFAIIGGTFDDCINGAYHDEGVSTGLGVYHAKGGKGELNNKDNLPVVICFSAGNLGNVIDAFMERGCENQRIAADNDCSKKHGNTGIYVAMVAAKKHNLPIFFPIGATGQSVDFADTLKFKTLNVNKMRRVDYLKKLCEIAPIAHLRKLGVQLAIAMAECVPFKMNIETAIRLANEILEKRGADIKKINVRGIIYNHVHKRAELVKQRNTLVKKLGLDIHDLKGKTNEEIAEHVNKIKGIWLDNRGMGAGKTKLMAMLRQLKKYDRIAYLTHRISLTKNASGIMELDYYNDLNYGEGTDGIALCANSLLKFKVETGGFNVLFLDEFRQILEHLIDGSVDNRQAVWDGFIAAIEAADFIVCSDADLNDRCTDFLKQHAGNKKIHLIETEQLEINGRTYHFLKEDNFKSIYIRILREWQNWDKAKRPFIGCTSKKEAKRLYKFLIENGIPESELLLLHSDNRGDDAQARFLADPNGVADEFASIIYSPTLGSGVSVEVDQFSNVYLLNSGNLTSNEAFQMTARYRNAKHVYIAFGNHTERNRMTDEDMLHEGFGKIVEHYTEHKGGANELGKARIALHAEQNADKNDFQNNFALLVELKGGVIDYSLTDESLTKEDMAALKGIAQRVKKADIADITVATDMSDSEFETQQNVAPTQEQSNRCYRYLTKKMAGLPYESITEVEVEHFINDELKKVTNLENLKATLTTCQAWDKQNGLTQDKLKSKTSIKTVIEPLIERLLAEEIIDVNVALRECNYLNQHAAELAVNGIGNYSHIGSRPVTTLANLVKQFGYKIGLLNQPRKDGKRIRQYALQPISHIHQYVKNRQQLSEQQKLDDELTY